MADKSVNWTNPAFIQDDQLIITFKSNDHLYYFLFLQQVNKFYQ